MLFLTSISRQLYRCSGKSVLESHIVSTTEKYSRFSSFTPGLYSHCLNLKMSCFEINETRAKDILQNVDNFIFDCDGVLWDGLTPIEGSADTLALLRQLGKKVFFLTNNSSSSRASYVQKSNSLGCPAKEEEMMCTAYAAALYLKNINFKGKVYVVGSPAMGEELDAFNIQHTGIGMDESVGKYLKNTEFKDMVLDPEINCVLVGFDVDISYGKICKAATYARREGCLFLATNEDAYLPLNCDVVIAGTGSIVASVKVPARKEPIVVGKPSPQIFNVFKDLHNLDPARTLMVGDRIDTDIALAKNCGLRSLLVLSGVVQREDLQGYKEAVNIPENIKNNLPEFVADKLWELGKYIKNSL